MSIAETWEERIAREQAEERAFIFGIVRKVCYAFVAFIALSVGLSSFFTVGERERALVFRWNKFTSVAQPGLHWKLPIVSSVVELPIDNRTTTIEKMSAGSRDQQEAILKASVNWRLNPETLGAFYARFGTVKNAEETFIAPRFNSRTKVVFGQFTAETTFSNRGALNAAIMADLQANLGDLIQVDGVQVENVDFDEKYGQAINERMQAEVEVARLKQNLERERVQAAIANTKADAERYRIETEGAAQASAAKAVGEAQAQAIEAKTKALRESPNLVQLELAQRWDGKTPATYIGQNGGALPILPLGNGLDFGKRTTAER